jgi:hypothetical protein
LARSGIFVALLVAHQGDKTLFDSDPIDELDALYGDAPVRLTV